MRFITRFEKPCYNCVYAKQAFFMGKSTFQCLLYPIFINHEKNNYATHELVTDVRKNSKKCGEYGKYYKGRSLVEYR